MKRIIIATTIISALAVGGVALASQTQAPQFPKQDKNHDKDCVQVDRDHGKYGNKDNKGDGPKLLVTDNKNGKDKDNKDKDQKECKKPTPTPSVSPSVSPTVTPTVTPTPTPTVTPTPSPTPTTLPDTGGSGR